MNEQEQELYKQIKYNTGAYDDDAISCAEIIYEMGYRKQIEAEWIPQMTYNSVFGVTVMTGCYCSECGEFSENAKATPYCGHCGAKIVGYNS